MSGKLYIGWNKTSYNVFRNTDGWNNKGKPTLDVS